MGRVANDARRDEVSGGDDLGHMYVVGVLVVGSGIYWIMGLSEERDTYSI